MNPAEPGLAFAVSPAASANSPLRSDVAGFVVRTRRGPPGAPVRVEGWREYARSFGGLDAALDGPYCLRGYFANGGQVAHVVRAAGGAARTAAAEWTVGTLAGGRFDAGSPAAGGFASDRYAVRATSPGTWGNGVAVSIRYRLQGRLGRPEVDVAVRAPGEPAESWRGLDPAAVAAVVNGAPLDDGGGSSQAAQTAGSALIRLEAVGAAPLPPLPGGAPGPTQLAWDLQLQQGTDGAPSIADYLAGAQALLDEPEVALLVVPDASAALATGDRDELVDLLLDGADAAHDRLLVLDLALTPAQVADSAAAARAVADLRARHVFPPPRNAALYHPPLLVADPLGGTARPLRTVPASGHVAGLISRLDRERGAHYTPANAEVVDASDLARELDPEERGAFYRQGVNLVRCVPGRGLLLWGAWTAATEPAALYVAHRRLIHRLVRGIRHVVEELVFDVNGPELWLTIIRAVTTVLLAAFRAGGLAGARADEAFRVVCDSSNNPPEQIDAGQVICDVSVAPAVPMEFITLRIALGEQGRLEVVA